MTAAKNWIGAVAAVTIGWVLFSPSDPAGAQDAATTASPMDEASSLSSTMPKDASERLTCERSGSSAEAPAKVVVERTAIVFGNTPGLGCPFATGSPPTAATPEGCR